MLQYLVVTNLCASANFKYFGSLSPQEKLAVDIALDGYHHCQSCAVIAPSTHRSSPSWDHFTFEYHSTLFPA